MKKIILTSLSAMLCACVLTNTNNVDVTTAGDEKGVEYIDGYKVYNYDETKPCGEKNKINNFIRTCDKETGEFLNGVIVDRSEHSRFGDSYHYYKNGFVVKAISYWKNGNVYSESKVDVNEKNLTKEREIKYYFKTGELDSVGKGKYDMVGHEYIFDEWTAYYINGVKRYYSKDGKGLPTETWDYDVNGNLILKGLVPYQDPNIKESVFDSRVVDKATRYGPDGKPYTGTITYHFAEYPDKVEAIVPLKNGKKDGISTYYNLEEYGGSIETNSNTYKDGKAVSYIDVPFDKETDRTAEDYYFDKTMYHRNVFPTGDSKVSVYCHYKGIDGSVGFFEKIAEKLDEKFLKDKSKTPCPSFDFIK